MVEWKGYEPGSPEAKKAAKEYVPPKAIIKEAPPAKPKAPPPRPAPPTLEPVIAQPYVPPVGGVAVEWASLEGAVDAQGKPDAYAIDKTKPTVLRTEDGVRHYTPHHHAMWESLGMRTSEDYKEYLRTGEASQYIGVTEGVDKPMLVSRRELAKASALKGEAQFQTLKDVGVIPSGAKFMPGPSGYLGKDWTWLHPDTLKKMKGEILARLARRSTKKPRVIIPPGMKVRPTGVPEPTGVPGGPPMPPGAITHPAYIGKRQSRLGKELLENPQSVINTLGKQPELSYFDKVIEAWNELWTQESLGELKLRTKAGIAELTGQEQKDYFDTLGEYNSQVTTYNTEIDKLNVTAGELEKAGAALPISLITQYNDDMARLNALSLSLGREGAGVNLESEKAVGRYNEKVASLGKDFSDLEHQAGGVNTALQEVEGFNTKIDEFNLALLGLVEPLDPPPEPLKTVGNFGRAIYEGLKTEYQGAAREGLTLTEKAKNVSLLTAELVVPGVWAWAPYTGKKPGIEAGLTPGEIALNVGLDMLIVIPVARMAAMLAKRALGSAAKAALKQALTAEAKIVQQSVKAMRKAYGKGAAQSLKKLSQLQAGYLKQLAKLEKLKVKMPKPTKAMRKWEDNYWALYSKKNDARYMGRGRQSFLDELAALERSKPKVKLPSQAIKASKLEEALRTASQNFIDEVQAAQTKLGKKGVVGAGFDSPDVARAFYKMPEEIVRHTQQAFRAIAKPKVKQSIKRLEADVVKAEATLQAAKAKTTFDASSWVDLVDDLMKKQALLSQRQAGSLAKMQQKLVSVSQELVRVKAKIFEATLKPPPKVAGKPKIIQRRLLAEYRKQRQLLKKTELNLERQHLDLTQKLHRGIKAMEVEWGRGGAVSRGGGIATAVKPRGAPSLVGGGAAVAAPTTATMTAEAVAARMAVTAAVVDVVGRPMPEIEEITKGLTDVEIIRKVEAETLKAMKMAEKLALKPLTSVGLDAKAAMAAEVAQRVRESLEKAARVAPSAKMGEALKTKVVPITALAKTVALKVAEKIAPLPIPKPIIIPKLLPGKKEDKEKRARILASKGALAWRHGELHGKDVFHVGLYPYTSDENYLIVVGKKPEGATVVKGPGSARQSIKLLYGKSPPRTVKGDIGFFDFRITPTGPKRVGITFKPDPQMQTRGDVTLGRRPPPITERRGSLGRSKSPRITQKTPRLRR